MPLNDLVRFVPAGRTGVGRIEGSREAPARLSVDYSPGKGGSGHVATTRKWREPTGSGFIRFPGGLSMGEQSFSGRFPSLSEKLPHDQ